MKIMNAVENIPMPDPAPMACPPSPKMKIKLVNARMMMCPALMFAVKRIINTAGFMMMLNTSIGTKMNFTGSGTPGGQKMWPQ